MPALRRRTPSSSGLPTATERAAPPGQSERLARLVLPDRLVRLALMELSDRPDPLVLRGQLERSVRLARPAPPVLTAR